MKPWRSNPSTYEKEILGGGVGTPSGENRIDFKFAL